MIAETLPVCSSPTTLSTYFARSMSEINYGKMRFVITDRPSDFALDTFVKELQRHRVKTVVRVCEPTYPTKPFNENGISVMDWAFVDGQPPPQEIIDKWLGLLKDYFITDNVDRSSDAHHRAQVEKSIAVHCVAGLGRAPVLVGVALLEAGMSSDDVVFLIRANRRGALNEKQLEFLKGYKPSGQLLMLRDAVDGKERNKSCQIM